MGNDDFIPPQHTATARKAAVVLGGTGLVGHHLLDALVASGRYQAVHALVRRMPAQAVAGVTYQVLEQFANPLPLLQTINHNHVLQGADAFSTLGTTLKQAGSQAAFEAVDLGYNLRFAEAMRQVGAGHFLLLSALGASAQSRFFYNRVKGELEQAVVALGFAHTSIFQPSLLLGPHEGRLGEALAQRAFAVVKPVLPKRFASRPIEVERVAKAMAQVAAEPDASQRLGVYSNLDLLKMTGNPQP